MTKLQRYEDEGHMQECAVGHWVYFDDADKVIRDLEAQREGWADRGIVAEGNAATLRLKLQTLCQHTNTVDAGGCVVTGKPLRRCEFCEAVFG